MFVIQILTVFQVLRDNNGWKPIASFFLVNLATGSKIKAHHLERLPIVFLRLLHLLQGHLFRRQLPLTWAPGDLLYIDRYFDEKMIVQIYSGYPNTEHVVQMFLKILDHFIHPLNNGTNQSIPLRALPLSLSVSPNIVFNISPNNLTK